MWDELHRNDKIDKNTSDSVQNLRPTVVFGEVPENIVVQVEITQVMKASASRSSVTSCTIRKCSC